MVVVVVVMYERFLRCLSPPDTSAPLPMLVQRYMNTLPPTCLDEDPAW